VSDSDVECYSEADNPAECRIRPEHLKRFRKACNELNAVMRRIQEYEPEARYYLQEDMLLLMTGPSHSDIGGLHPHSNHRSEPLRENVADGVELVGSIGGAW